MIEALDFMHKQDIAHRDIKPDNILLDKDFSIKISDFGFAKQVENSSGLKRLTTNCGTDQYKAPEILEEKPYDGKKVDLFALAKVLFIMTSGFPPFEVATLEDFYYKLIAQNKWDSYWKNFYKATKLGPDFLSESFKSLV